MQNRWHEPDLSSARRRRLAFERMEERRLLSWGPAAAEATSAFPSVELASLTGTVGGYSVSIDRHDAPGQPIDASEPAWLVIHGNNSAPATSYIDDLADALHTASSGDQVLTLDWSTIAALAIGTTENNIIPVAEWASSALTSYGFSGDHINPIGHSFGAYVAAEAAERIPGGVNTVVGLDPAENWPFGYNPETSGQVDFAGYSAYSWTFSDAGGFYGSEVTPGSAHEAVAIESTDHSGPVRLFTNMLNGVGSPDVLQHFPISRLLEHAPGPWAPNQYDHSGDPTSSGTFEAVITADAAGDTALSIEFVPLEPNDPPTAEPLGPVDFHELNDLDPSLGDLWYSLETRHPGFLTIVSLDPGGVVTLYDTNIDPLPPDASQRVDWRVAEGEKYYFTVSGPGSNVDLRLANLLSHAGTNVVVHGTPDEDLLEFDAAASRLVTINGVSYHFTDEEATVISFHGGAATDTAVLHGNDQNETAELWPGHGTLTGEGYRVAISDVETVTAIGGEGADVALLHGSSGVKDTLTGGPDTATLSGNQYSNRVTSFRYVHVYGTPGGDDEAVLQGDPNGQDTFRAGPGEAKVYGERYLLRAKSFRDVRADATQGGDDVALLHDDPVGIDTFVGGLDQATLSGGEFSLQANFFRYVHAYGTAGGSDVATLHDDPDRFDKLRVWPDNAQLAGERFFLRAKSFGSVYANSTTGGEDLAQLYDSITDDTFTAWPDRAELSGDTFFVQANSYRWVHGYSGGGNDVATLYGSDDRDVFVGTDRFGKLRGTDFYNRAVSFGQIHVYGRGGRDVAVLHDAVLETGVTQPLGMTQVAWLYEFERIRQRTAGSESVVDATDEIFTAYWE